MNAQKTKDVKKIINILWFMAFLVFTEMSPLFSQKQQKQIITGAERTILYKPILKNKTIALVANQTSVVGNRHLVDTLLTLGANIKKIFCPEHGFRGNEDAGEQVKNGKDPKTGIPVISLYGKKLKPTAADLNGIDFVIYDIQDVGVRFYTYISTLTYVMEACAEQFVTLFILDSPNPNGFYVDGPVLEPQFKSFVGMHPIPIVYGMTIGELATMINEEGWLPRQLKCSIGLIHCQNYTHKSLYRLAVNPSPNLQNMRAVYLYPSLGLFEGTAINVGRGTDFPFQVFGYPKFTDTTFSYIPRSIEGVSSNPPNVNKTCFGIDLRGITEEKLIQSSQLNISYLKFAYDHFPEKEKFFNSFFENLCGSSTLRQQIISGISPDSIRHSWQPALTKFKELRKKYLIYEDFE
jgi:uncharacterized protein YbbC (DUF1343 family)